MCACSEVAKARCKTKLESEKKRSLYLNRGKGRGAALGKGRPREGAQPLVVASPRRPHMGLGWASVYSSGPSFFSSMTKFRSLARARVIGPDEEVGGTAGVDVLVL